MQPQSIAVDQSISLFVKDILVFEETNRTTEMQLPFYADGYPGLLYHETENGLVVVPHDKKMPEIFLYGQTIKPIGLVLQGPFRLIVFQLYPFVPKSFFNINPSEINDNCYDLETFFKKELVELQNEKNLTSQIAIISSFLFAVFQQKKAAIDAQIKEAIEIITENKGLVVIKSLSEKLKLNSRTFERRFLKEVGLSAKQFSKIIQFQQALGQLETKDYDTLSDVVYQNGFADQSHFIRVFKAYTHKTPKQFDPKT